MYPVELNSAWLKVGRAAEHLEALQREMVRFFSTEPQMVTCETRENVTALTLREDFPARWSLYIGDTLQNLRAALDHAAYEVVTTHDPSANPSSIQFPIALTEAEWLGERVGRPGQRRWVKNASPAAQRVFRSLQPDRTCPEDAARDPLYILNKLANMDKHRAVHMTIGQTTGRFIGFGEPIERIGNVVVDFARVPDSRFIAGSHSDTETVHTSDGPIESYTNQFFDVFFAWPGAERSDFAVLQSLEVIGDYISERVLPDLAPFAR